jgi:alcohol dehydrogenase class IV
MAHALGHSLGAVLPVPHGRAVGLCLPYTIEFTVRGWLPTRYAEFARWLGLSAADEPEGATRLAEMIRDLSHRIDQPTTLEEAGVSQDAFEAALPKLTDNAINDSAMTISLRFPEDEEVEKIYRYIYEGRPIDF